MTRKQNIPRKDYLERVTSAIEGGSPYPQMGIDFATAGIGTALIAGLLPCDERTVRRWFTGGTIPRMGDSGRLYSLHRKTMAAYAAGKLPSRGTVEEILSILTGPED